MYGSHGRDAKQQNSETLCSIASIRKNHIYCIYTHRYIKCIHRNIMKYLCICNLEMFVSTMDKYILYVYIYICMNMIMYIIIYMHVSVSVCKTKDPDLSAPKTHRATNLCDTINAKAHIKVPWATKKKSLGEHLWFPKVGDVELGNLETDFSHEMIKVLIVSLQF